MDIIYQPQGKAREYAPLACNLYTGCSHGCLYCFGPAVLHKSREEFHNNVQPKKDALKRLEKDAKKLRGDDREILLSFVTDPYQPLEMELGITRQAIEILIKNDLRFTILTKGGTNACRDFELLEGYDKCSFGSTFTVYQGEDRQKWEPYATPAIDRTNAVIDAKSRRIKTWVSLEPVIDPEQALYLIQHLGNLVDYWKIGRLNYQAPPKPVDWVQFRENAKILLDSIDADYYFKKSLTDL